MKQAEWYSLPMPVLLGARWRVDGKVGRLVYAQLGEGWSDRDPLIGVMDSPALAAEVVRAHNKLRSKG